MPRGTSALPNATRPFRGRATAPRPPHTAALDVLGGRTDAAAQLGDRGVERCPPGGGLIDPRDGGESAGSEGFPSF